ncbi:MAG: hypothetical protein FWD05_02850 [Oscillospiraceae bacterium]|nr:hypothetical protein [Oscillospiraceae bacterium]
MEQSVQKSNGKLSIAILIMLLAGVVLAMHITNMPLVKVNFGTLTTAGQLWTNIAILFMFLFCGVFISLLLSKKTSPTFRFILSTILLLISLLAAILQMESLPYVDNYYLFWRVYNVSGGIGVGIAYSTLFSTTNLWFPKNIGFFLLMLLTGFVIGVLVIGSIIYVLINVANIDWLRVYSIFSIILGICVIIAAAVFRFPFRKAG